MDPSKSREREDIKDVIKDNPEKCGRPVDINCRIASEPDLAFEDIRGQHATCDLENGLECQNHPSQFSFCYDYEIRVRCCHYEPCATTPPVTTPSVTTPVVTTSSVTTPVVTTPTQSE